MNYVLCTIILMAFKTLLCMASTIVQPIVSTNVFKGNVQPSKIKKRIWKIQIWLWGGLVLANSNLQYISNISFLFFALLPFVSWRTTLSHIMDPYNLSFFTYMCICKTKYSPTFSYYPIVDNKYLINKSSFGTNNFSLQCLCKSYISPFSSSH